ncbi:MAG TPA: ankyrin repeat domain-containing protein [Bryobacteraceae bacterium]
MPPPRPSRNAAWKPLFDACFAGDDEQLRVLLKAGADPNQVAPSEWRQRPLHRVCEYRISAPKHAGHDRCIDLLLTAGADPTLRANVTNMRPVELAALAGMEKAAARLQGEGPDIFAAAAVGDAVRVATILRRRPAAAKQVDEAGCSALWYGAASRVSTSHPRKDRWGTAGILLDAGADPNTTGIGVPALHMALGHTRNFALAEILLLRGADLNANTSLLHSACAFHFEFLQEGLEWLASHGADLSPCLEKAESLRYHKIARWLRDRHKTS